MLILNSIYSRARLAMVLAKPSVLEVRASASRGCGPLLLGLRALCFGRAALAATVRAGGVLACFWIRWARNMALLSSFEGGIPGNGK